ncbi:hypothetical protein YC2023_018022 [Brassica napus]
MREARPVPRRENTVESLNGENSSLLLADLKGGRCRNTIEVRLLKFWEDRNVKKRGELMGVDMLIFA